MSSASEHVSLTITTDTVGIARAGFGVPMILSHNATWVERIRFYGGIADVADDWATDSPEYLAAKAMFAQTPHPEQIAIGRAALKPTQQYAISVAAVRNSDSSSYQINVAGQGFTAATASYTSDSTATNDEIATGLVTALNAVTGKNYTAATTGTTGSLTITVTANAAGSWFSLELVDVSALTIKQSHIDPGIATDLDAILKVNTDWYALITLYNSQALVAAAASWTESNTKLYFPCVNETAAIQNAVAAPLGSADTLQQLASLNYTRTAGCYHPSPIAFMAAAWVGRMLPIDPGEDDWKWKSLAGVASVALTATHRVNLRARHANTVEQIYGTSTTWEGTVANGDFIDNTRGIDWLNDDMSKGVFGALKAVNKVPYTNAGIALIENEVRASLARATAKGILTDDPKFVVNSPKVADISSSNKALRLLPDIKFSATLAGAIHKVVISGVVSV